MTLNNTVNLCVQEISTSSRLFTFVETLVLFIELLTFFVSLFFLFIIHNHHKIVKKNRTDTSSIDATAKKKSSLSSVHSVKCIDTPSQFVSAYDGSLASTKDI